MGHLDAQPLTNDSDNSTVFVDAEEDRYYQTECPDCGRWFEAWEVNEHIARDHYGQVDEDE